MFRDPDDPEYTDCKRCGVSFEKRSWNDAYCDDCKKPHRNERLVKNYHAKHGGKPRERKQNVWSTGKRFSFYMDKTWQSAICPVCGAHMSVDPCSSASDPGLSECRGAGVQTWKPWK